MPNVSRVRKDIKILVAYINKLEEMELLGIRRRMLKIFP